MVAQQTPQYSLYWFNKFLVTPAYAGLEERGFAHGLMRNQWSGLVGAPRTQVVSVHLPAGILRGGVGLSLQNDRIGAHRTTDIRMAYAWHTRLGKRTILSAGANAGVLSYKLSGASLITPDGNYDTDSPDHQDGLLPISAISALTPVFDAGVYLKSEALEVGLGVQQLTGGAVPFSAQGYTNIGLRRHYTGLVSGKLDIARDWELLPSVLLKTDLTQFQTDATILTRYRGNITAGITFRGYNTKSIDALSCMAGVFINDRFFLQYAFDYTLSSLRSVQTGTHEFGLSYYFDSSLGKGRLPGVIHNTRHL